MTDRRQIRLGDVAALEYGRALPDRDRDGLGFPVLGSNGVVGMHSVPHVPEPGIVVGRKGTAGSVTWVDSPFTPIDTTYWVRLLDPVSWDRRFLCLALENADLPSICAQTGVPGLNRDRAYELLIPAFGIEEQRRIVDLLASVDAHESALASEAAGLQAVLARQLERFLTDASGAGTRVLGELCRIGSGPSWSARNEFATPSSEALRVLKITNTQPGGRLDLTEQTYVTGLPTSTVTLDDASLILIRTNGNRSRIGNVYRPSREALGAAVSAFQFIAKTSDTCIRDYLFAILRTPSVQSRMSEAASGSTGLGNLSVSWLKALTIPWPDEGVRAAHVEQGQALDRNITALQDELTNLHTARSALLGDLLRGEVGIVDTYDDLLESA